ncbi:MAG: DUF362 domain-containing protein [Armatimonadetes bacterium]|nr:DUF362 domain-containing protein [Armatimonadota bacterium]
MVRKISRREFLKGAAVTGVGIYGAAVLPLELNAAESGKSRIVMVTGANVLANPDTNANTPTKLGMASVGEADSAIDQSVLNSMISQGMTAFTGSKSEAAAWKSLFKPSDVVGIKVNCLFAKGASTRPEVVASIIAGLELAGVKPENIIVWDRNDREMIRAGFVINRTGSGVAVYGTEGEYEAEPTKVGSFSGRLSKILTEKITVLINAPVLKDHSMAGITCAMKNHYGSHVNPGDHHANNGDPFMAELNSIPSIKNKTRLIVCDAVKPQCNGGPGLKAEFVWDYRTILIAADPVAMDYQGWQIIEQRRKEIGLKTFADGGRPTKFIATAASLGLGTDDPSRMEIVRKTV